MKVEDALRRIRLLRRVIPANGAFEAEAETATRLAQVLMERHAISADDVRPLATPSARMTWIYWEQLLTEFGMRLERFGRRACVRLGTACLSLSGSRLTSGTRSIHHPMAGKSWLGILAWKPCARIWPTMGPRLLTGGLETAKA
jgi:Protein of unknown function (DUF2786)